MSGSKAASAPALAPSPEQCAAWLQRVHDVQTKQLTPERRQELQQRIETSRQRQLTAKKCKAVSGNAKRSNALARETLRQMSTAVNYLEVSSRWASAQQASESRQLCALERLEHRKEAAEVAEVEEASDDEEALAEAAGLMGGADVGQLAADSAAAGSPVAGPAAMGARSSETDDLLKQLRQEPADGAECAAKFQLYEGYSQQVEKIRKLLFDFVEESALSVPAAVEADMKKQLAKIDSTEAMGIPDDTREWFVYHMMVVADRNNRQMAAVLDSFQKKLEFLAKSEQAECPVCLEAFEEEGAKSAETLGCCHKICKECWAYWREVQGGRPFCPLCRNDEFLHVVASSAAARFSSRAVICVQP